MRQLLLCSFLIYTTFATAQIDKGLIGYFSFDDCSQLGKESRGETTQDGLVRGQPECDCGVQGNALSLNGRDDKVNFIGPLVGEFNRIDFSISFYFKPNSLVGSQDLISKLGPNCSAERAFTIRYTPFNKRVTAVLSENASKAATVSGTIDPDACWQHVVVVRRNTEFILFLNGKQVALSRTSTRANIENTAPFAIANSPCINSTDVPFKGLIDELRIYNRALERVDIESLYLRPDKIERTGTILLLGNELNIKTTATCASAFRWSPLEGVANPTQNNTTIKPPTSGEFTYTLEFDDGNCIARDNISITVLNPEDFDCDGLFLANTFTPNGDNINDTFGISNPFVVEELISFEIFDRWGSRMFFTDSPVGRWDGTFKDKVVDPGVFLYKINYVCQGIEVTKSGSVTIMR